MIKFKTVAISSSTSNKRVVEIGQQCIEILNNLKVNVLLTKNLEELSKKTNQKTFSDTTVLKRADLLISIGGDGTLLGCARRFGSKGIPILGINLGNLGFLSDLAPEDMTSKLRDIIHGDYLNDTRLFLEARIGSSKKFNIAVNEIVIHSETIAQLIEYELFIDKVFVYQQKADGLIISSPTGSTAYSLSGGGPIVHPNLKAITLLPMFPHSLSTSPLLVNSKSELLINLVSSQDKTKISFDSHNFLNVKQGDSIRIISSDSYFNLIHPRDHDFFSACRNKLGWSSKISN